VGVGGVERLPPCAGPAGPIGLGLHYRAHAPTPTSIRRMLSSPGVQMQDRRGAMIALLLAGHHDLRE
jgi:hypothetical protein